MTLWRLAWQSLRYYRRSQAAVAGGVAVSVAVLAGSFLVGSSVRASLSSLANARLGRTSVAVAAETLFPESLAGRVVADVTAGTALTPAAPILALQGVVAAERSKQRASRVAVYGVDARFFQFHAVSARAPDPGDVWLSPELAEELGVSGDDQLVVRVARPTDVPLDALHASRDEAGRSVRLRYMGTLAREDMGAFSLTPDQGVARAAFVNLQQLQDDLDQAGRVNTILLGEPAPASAVRQALARQVTPEDLGLRFSVSDDGRVLIESRAGVIPDRLAAAATSAAREAARPATPVLSWLATRLRVGTRETPYSLVTAIGGDLDGDAELSRLLQQDAAGPAPIVLNDWTARDLAAKIGDTLTLEYFRWADEGRLVTEQATFRVAGQVPIRGLASDRRLAPDFPGITDAASFSDWNPPFPIDLRRVRPVDEQYWDQYRATPKAFIPLAAGQALWRTRYGQLTSIRVASSAGDALAAAALASALSTGTVRSVDPLGAGFSVVDVRRERDAAAVGATDFGAYFAYFSFFLVAAATLLAALFFRLGVEQRLEEIGILRATGFSLSAIRRVWHLEGGLVAVSGAALGCTLAIGWAALMMYGLRTWWVGAVGTRDLALHVDARSLFVGAAIGLAATFLSIALTIRALARFSPRTLISGGRVTAPPARASRAWLLAWTMTILAAGLSVASIMNRLPAVAGFFGAGAAVLVAGLATFRAWLGLERPAVLDVHRGGALARLALANAAWRPGRSLTVAALIAAAVFLLVSVDAFRKRTDDTAGRSSGTGGFALFGETTLPYAHDPSTPAGMDALGVAFGTTDPDLAGVSMTSARLRPGDDTSCVNLYKPAQPRIVGVGASFIEANRFRFRSSLAATPAERENPWRLLGPPDAAGVVPAIVDATSLQYVLHAAVGDEITIDVETSRPVTLKIVAALADSMLQGEIIIGEPAFLALYPNIPGYRLMLVDVEGGRPERITALTALLEERMDAFGLDLELSRRRLEAFHRVENTYLSTFQALGGLGLVLGSFGLVAVIARNVVERRRELALLSATGATGGTLQRLVLIEHGALILVGLLVGVASAAVAIAPVVIQRSSGWPAMPVAWIAVVGVTGLAASLAATRQVRRLPRLASLRGE